jgi:predicted nucleic acid-binding protein
MTYIFDACALIAYLNQEEGEGFEEVDELFGRAETGEITIYMSIVNLVEVYYGYIGDCGVTIADEIMRPVFDFPMQIISNIADVICRETARFKGICPLSLADAFLCATAKSLSATIVTKDSEIAGPEAEEGLPVFWIK